MNVYSISILTINNINVSSAGYPTSDINYSTNIRNVSEHDVSIYNNEIGSISGIVNVSPKGEAQYVIPIFCIPGTNGLQPELNLTYNNNSGNSQFGQGWSLSGLSSISRVGKDKFNDGTTEEVLFSQDGGLLALDGKRLIITGTDQNNNAIYSSKIGNTIQVTHDYGSGYDKYIVKTKEGHTIEYGGTANSRIMNSNYYYIWMKTKLTDINGNYIEFKYGQQDGEIWIEEIVYTGNTVTGTLPYAKVKFEYKIRSDKNTTYFNGESYKSTLLLDQIIVEYNPTPNNPNTNEIVRKYQIDYKKYNYSQIRQITEYGDNGVSKLNSTVFEYDVNTSSNLPITAKKLNPHNIESYLSSGDSFDNVGKETYYFADFNADGIIDRMVVENDHDGSKEARWFLQKGQHYECDGSFDCGNIEFVNDPNNLYQFTTKDLQAETHRLLRDEVIAQDINNDGYPDLIIPWLSGKDDEWDGADMMDVNTNQFEKLKMTIIMNNNGSFINGTTITYNLHDDRLKGDDYADVEERFITGDFDGDGYLELLLKSERWDYYEPWNSSEYVHNGWLNSYGNLFILDLTDGNGNLYSNVDKHKLNYSGTNHIITGHPHELFQIIPADYNKDGKTDFLLIDDLSGNDKIYELNESSPGVFYKSELFELGSQLKLEYFSRKIYNYHTGDFNGDGNIDLLYRNVEFSNQLNAQWEIKFWEGDDFSNPIAISELGNSWWDHPDNPYYYEIFVNDFDGDGKSDIMTYHDSHFYNTGTGEYEYSYKFNLYAIRGRDNSNLIFDTFSYDEIFNPTNYWTDPLNLEDNIWIDIYSPRNPMIPKGKILKTDFNNNSKADIYNYINNGSILSFFEGTGTGELVSVYDGYNNKTEINYEVLANEHDVDNGNSAYLTSSNSVPSEYIKTGGSYKVVSKINTYINGDHQNPLKTTNYYYEDGISHLDGKGFLGFKKFTEEYDDPDLGELKTKYNNVIDQTYVLLELNQIKTERSGIELLTTNYLYGVNTSIGADRYFKYPHITTKIDHLTGIVSQTTDTYDNNENLLQSNITFGDGINPAVKTVNKVTTYNNPVGTWCKAFPMQTTITTSHSDDVINSNYIRTTKLYYKPSGHIDYIENDPFSGNNMVTTTFEYDLYGNVTKKTKSNSLMPSIIEEKLYDDKGRFILKEFNMLGQFTESIYDEKYGNVKKSYDVYGNYIDYDYDEFGRLTKTTDQYSNVKEEDFIWDYKIINIGGINYRNIYKKLVKTFDVNVNQESDKLVQENFYNSLNQKIQSKSEIFSDDYINNQKNVVIDQEYYKNGNMKKESYPYFENTSPTRHKEYSYDATNLKVKTINDNGKTTTYNYNGRVTTVTDPKNRTTSQEINFAGDLRKSIDEAGNEVNYFYHNNGKIEQTTTLALNSADALTIKIKYDEFGRKEELVDPDAGTFYYYYNPYGQLRVQKNQNGIEKNYYDLYGRLEKKEYWDYDSLNIEQELNYLYVVGGNGQGQLHKIIGPAIGQEQENIYDIEGRLSNYIEKIDTEVFNYNYNYNPQTGRISTILFESGVELTHDYDIKGFLYKKRRTDGLNNETIWKLNQVDELGRTINFSRGNNDLIINQLGYNSHDYLTDIQSQVGGTNIQNIHYEYDEDRNVMKSREDFIHKMKENFEYGLSGDDDYKLNRLTEFKVIETINSTVLSTSNIAYNKDGGVSSKSNVGSYQYSSDGNPTAVRPHAIKSLIDSPIENPPATYTYTHFNSVKTIERCDIEGIFEYAPDQNRRKYTHKENNIIVYDKYYFNNYEKIVNYQTGITKEITYLDGSVIVKETGQTEKLYYINSDNIGSITQLINESGQIQFEFNYDPWGRLRDANDWSIYSLDYQYDDGFDILERGFTGHEHMVAFNLINMNGRVYDPVLGQFIQPDNYVQLPEYAGSYNSFSYALNNPLMYTDPSGELIEPATIGIALFYIGLAYSVADVVTTYIDRGMDAAFKKAVGVGIAYGASSVISGMWGLDQISSESILSIETFGKFAAASVSNSIFMRGMTGSLSSYGWDSFGMDLASGTQNWGMAVGMNEYAMYVSEQNNEQLRNSNGNGSDATPPATSNDSPDLKYEKNKTIVINRIKETKLTTLGEFYIEGTDIKGYTLERGGPSSRVEGDALRIEAGEYGVEVRYSPSFKKKMLYLTGVKGTKHSIMLHYGNYVYNTTGCIVFGSPSQKPTLGYPPKWEEMGYNYGKHWQVWNSENTYNKIITHFNKVGYDNIKVIINEIPTIK